MTTHKIYVNGKVHVRQSQCSTCIFGPNSPVTDERRDGMVRACAEDDSGAGTIACHHHLHQGLPVEPVCRGFYDLDQTPILRLAEITGNIAWVQTTRHQP